MLLRWGSAARYLLTCIVYTPGRQKSGLHSRSKEETWLPTRPRCFSVEVVRLAIFLYTPGRQQSGLHSRSNKEEAWLPTGPRCCSPCEQQSTTYTSTHKNTIMWHSWKGLLSICSSSFEISKSIQTLVWSYYLKKLPIDWNIHAERAVGPNYNVIRLNWNPQRQVASQTCRHFQKNHFKMWRALLLLGELCQLIIRIIVTKRKSRTKRKS